MNTDEQVPAAQPDADIARTAQSVLQWTTPLPPGCVKVKVENGWITLSGDVEWEFQKEAAVRAVHQPRRRYEPGAHELGPTLLG